MPPKGSGKSSPTKKATSNDRPSSPTSLLWAHQLKREHAFLLQKFVTLENSIKTVERNAKRNENDHDIAAIAEQVQALTNGGDIQRIRKEVMSSIDSLQGDLEAVVLQVAELSRQTEQTLDAKKKQFEAEKEVIKRVKEVEAGLAKSQSLLEEMGDRVSEEKMDLIRTELREIVDKVRDEGSTAKKLGESLEVLEKVTRLLREDNEKVAREVQELKERGATAPMNDMQDNAIAPGAPAGAAKPKSTKKAAPKKKGTADTAAASQQLGTGSQRPRKGRLERELADLQKSEMLHPRKAHNAADVDKKPAIRKGRGWVEVAESESQEHPAPTVTAPESTQSVAETAKRGRGAAKKADIAIPSTEEIPESGPGRIRGNAAQASRAPPKRKPRKDATQASQAAPKPAPKRRNVKQDDNEDGTHPAKSNANSARKRNADTLLDEFISTSEPISSTARPQPVRLAPAGAKKKPQLRRDQGKPQTFASPPSPRPENKKGARRGLTNVWSQSPISSSMSEGETQEAFGPGPEASRKRSDGKEEFDEEELLRRLSRGEDV